MDYLTNLYKAKAEQLQERYNFLQEEYKKILEALSYDELIKAKESIHDILGVSPEASKEEIKRAYRKLSLKFHPDQNIGLPEAEKLAAENKFKDIAQAYEIASDPEKLQKYKSEREVGVSQKESARQRRTANAEARAKQQAQQTQPQQQTSSTSERVRDPYAEYNAAARKRAEQRQAEQAAQREARAAKGQTTTGSTEPKISAPETKTLKTTTTTAKVPTKAKIGGGAANIAGYFGGEYLTRKALEAAGVENETAKDIGSSLGGGVVGELAGAGTAAALGGAAMPATAAGLAALAGTGLAVGAAGYLGAKAGEAISNIEVNKKGETVADVGGKLMYDYVPQVKMVTNLLAGNKILAGTGDLNEKPKGVPGGDKALMAKQEEEEKAHEEEKKQALSSAVARKVERMRQQRAQQRQGTSPEAGSAQ